MPGTGPGISRGRGMCPILSLQRCEAQLKAELGVSPYVQPLWRLARAMLHLTALWEFWLNGDCPPPTPVCQSCQVPKLLPPARPERWWNGRARLLSDRHHQGTVLMNGQFRRLSCQFCPLGNVGVSQTSLLPTCGQGNDQSHWSDMANIVTDTKKMSSRLTWG